MKPWAWFQSGTALRCERGFSNKLEILQDLFWMSFRAETSSDPNNWRDDDRTRGHCAVVALLVQDILGGEILRASLEEVTGYEDMRSHYWNRLSNGLQVDFTADQFKNRARDLMPRGEARTRRYLLGNEKTKARYEMLRTEFIGMLKLSVEYHFFLGKKLIPIPKEAWLIKF